MPVYQLSATYRISELELFGITVNWTLPLATSMYHVSYPLMTFRVVYYPRHIILASKKFHAFELIR